MRTIATIAMLCAGAFASMALRAGGDEDSVAAKLPGLWFYQAHYGPAVQGILTIDGRNREWLADIGGFDVIAVREGEHLHFELPANQGAFRGQLRHNRAAIDGFWIQPPGTTLNSAYATPIVLRAVSKDVWVGRVSPLLDRATMHLNIARDHRGALTGFIRNPEFNFGVSRPFRLDVKGDEVSFINVKRENDVLQGSFDSETGHLSMLFQGVGRFEFSSRDIASTPGAIPRLADARQSTYRMPVSTDDGWTTAAPESAGIRADALMQLTDHVRQQRPESVNTPYLHAILIARHGRLVYEEYFHGFDREALHDTRSAGKTLTSIMLGIALEQTDGIDVDTPVVQLFPQFTDLQNLDTRKSRLTVGQLLTMTSGLDCDDNDSESAGNEDVMQSQQAQPDWHRYALDLKVLRDPGGNQAVYCSAGINLLGGIVAKLSGLALPEFFQRYLAAPLQIERYHMNLMPNGEGYAAGGIYLRPRDALKFGQLYLAKGRWHGRRIVSPQWVEASTRRYAQFDDRHGYGYAWHLHQIRSGGRTYESYAAEGNGGQFIIVVPELDLTVMIAAANYGDFKTWYPFQDLVSTYVIPAIEKVSSTGAK